jgi:hypothetical protein
MTEDELRAINEVCKEYFREVIEPQLELDRRKWEYLKSLLNEPKRKRKYKGRSRPHRRD